MLFSTYSIIGFRGGTQNVTQWIRHEVPCDPFKRVVDLTKMYGEFVFKLDIYVLIIWSHVFFSYYDGKKYCV